MFRPAGGGDLDLEAIIGHVEGSGYGGWYVLEQDIMLDSEPSGDDEPLADVRRSFEYVKGRLGASAAASPGTGGAL
jgi:inosose dehydratase